MGDLSGGMAAYKELENERTAMKVVTDNHEVLEGTAQDACDIDLRVEAEADANADEAEANAKADTEDNQANQTQNEAESEHVRNDRDQAKSLAEAQGARPKVRKTQKPRQEGVRKSRRLKGLKPNDDSNNEPDGLEFHF